MGYKINFLCEIFWLEEHKNGLTYKSDAYRKLIWLRPILSEVEIYFRLQYNPFDFGTVPNYTTE